MEEIEAIAVYLLGKMPSRLADAILGELAEGERVNDDILERMFDAGGTGVKVSVCLRDDLNKRLEEKCRTSPINAVREHYESRVRRRSGIHS